MKRELIEFDQYMIHEVKAYKLIIPLILENYLLDHFPFYFKDKNVLQEYYCF